MTMPPLNFTGGAAGPSQAGGSSVNVGGLTLGNKGGGPLMWAALAAAAFVLWRMIR